MVRLSQSQERARRRIMELGQRSLLPSTLGGELLETIASVVPADRLTLFGVDPGTLLINRVFASRSDIGHRATDWLRTTYLVSEPSLELSSFGLIHAGVLACVHRESMETSWGVPRWFYGSMSPERYRREYAALGSPAGGILRACFRANGLWVGTFDSVRFDPSSPFAPSDVAFMRTIVPMVGSAIAAALRREQVQTAVTAVMPLAAGVVLVAPDGPIRFQTPVAEEWMQLLRQCWWEPTDDNAGLPGSLWSAIAPLRARDGRQAVGVIRTRTPAGLVRIEATMGPDNATIAIVIGDSQPTTAPAIPHDWPLTEAERRVVTLLVLGQNNAEIARQLLVSGKTVESHLGHVYEKLGVGSRLEVVARYFQQTHLPFEQRSNAASTGTPITTNSPSLGRLLGRH